MKRIYLAGGCFWGLEEYMHRLKGVKSAVSGYANGIDSITDPSYRLVCTGTTNFAETVEVVYDENEICLKEILTHYMRLIDPTSLNIQGGDRGTQYRTGIYYENEEDRELSEAMLEHYAAYYERPIVVELEPIRSFYKAEDYHQLYLQKNPGGYCHIDLNLALIEPDDDEAGRKYVYSVYGIRNALYDRPKSIDLRLGYGEELYKRVIDILGKTDYKDIDFSPDKIAEIDDEAAQGLMEAVISAIAADSSDEDRETEEIELRAWLYGYRVKALREKGILIER